MTVHEASRDKLGQTVCGLAFEHVTKGDEVQSNATGTSRPRVTCTMCIIVDELAHVGAVPLESAERLEPSRQAAREAIRRANPAQLGRVAAFLSGGVGGARFKREPAPAGTVDTLNEYAVALWGDGVTLLCPPVPRESMTRAQALTLAAWLVAIAEETPGDFARYLLAVQST